MSSPLSALKPPPPSSTPSAVASAVGRSPPPPPVVPCSGWGVIDAQRLLLLWDMLNHPSYSDAGVTNWVLGAGGRAIRIDWDNPKKRVVQGPEYTDRLQRTTLGLPPLDWPHVDALCPCCRPCWAHPWGSAPAPPACHACFVCMQRGLAPRFAPAAVPAHAFRSSGFEPVSQASKDRKCYPYS